MVRSFLQYAIFQIRAIRNRRRISAKVRQFFRGVEHTSETKGRVLHYVGIGSMYLTPVEILMYHLLRRNGYEVDYLVYDSTIPINEVVTKVRDEEIGGERFWAKSYADTISQLKAGKVQYETITVDPQALAIVGNINSLEELLSFQLDEIDFGNIVEGTMYRYFKSLTFGPDALSVGKRMLTTALTNYFAISRKCDEYRYDFVMFSHGIYVTWQPVVEYCRKHDVNFICYDRAKTLDHGNFNVNQVAPDWSFDSAWKRFGGRKLTAEEKKRVHSYLADRELQKGDVYAYNSSERESDIAALKSRLGIPLHRKCITIFTNLIWDAANVSRDIAFPSALACICETIEKYRNRDDIQIVVRAHPAEKVLGTKEQYTTLVKEHFGSNLPENLTLISPSDDINSFTMIDLSDVGVVNTSTVGLEMAVLGKPVILISMTHYRSKGFTCDVTDRDSYFAAIENCLGGERLTQDQIALAEKYFFMMMFLYQLRLPTRYTNSLFEGFCCSHFDRLSPEEPLVKLIGGLSQGVPEDFVNWETSPITRVANIRSDRSVG